MRKEFFSVERYHLLTALGEIHARKHDTKNGEQNDCVRERENNSARTAATSKCVGKDGKRTDRATSSRDSIPGRENISRQTNKPCNSRSIKNMKSSDPII